MSLSWHPNSGRWRETNRVMARALRDDSDRILAGHSARYRIHDIVREIPLSSIKAGLISSEGKAMHRRVTLTRFK